MITPNQPEYLIVYISEEKNTKYYIPEVAAKILFQLIEFSKIDVNINWYNIEIATMFNITEAQAQTYINKLVDDDYISRTTSLVKVNDRIRRNRIIRVNTSKIEEIYKEIKNNTKSLPTRMTIDEIKLILNEAILREEYEYAAEIRDFITESEKEVI